MPTINQAGLSLIENFEGCRLTSYQDSGGIWTIGFGHTGNIEPNQTITQGQADAFLEQDLESAEEAVQNATEIDLTPNQFAALVSFQYNTGSIPQSPGMALINQRQFEAAWDDHFCLWTRDANGEVLEGLVRRRAAEKALFFATD